MPVATDEKPRQELDSTLDRLEQKKRDKVLQCFQYRQMEDREDDIGTAYGATFKWMFDKDDDYTDWDDFPAFLRDKLNTQPYWVNGKAGSGKSTLMKYLLNSEEALEALQTWAGYKTVVIASFFFWNLGTPLQKSMLGFLNTILYQLLRSQPDLIRIVLEDIWPKIDPDESTMTPLSFSEAKRTFHKLLGLPRSFNICLFVDGIDEFDGDYLEIAAYLRSLCRPDIKVIVSSRPLAACFEIFSDCPSLQLEHLTHDDIKTFVDGNLASHAYMRELMQDQPKEAQELIQEVSVMSSGVFLWVRLVIRSLLEGLRNGDNIVDLQGRLQELPADLEDLFQHMLDRLDVRDHEQAVQYFEVFRTATDIVDQPFEAIDMYYAQAGPDECLGEAVRALNVNQAIKKCKQLEKRIRSRCCGLLEFHRPTSLLMSHDILSHHRRRSDENFNRLLPYARIQYLHRTVAEFLYSPGVWSKLCRQGSSHEFDVYQSLLHVYAARLNSMHYSYQHHEEKTVSDYTNALLFCEQRLELRAGRCHVHIVDITIPFMKTIWTGPWGLAVPFWRSVNDDQASIISRWSRYQYVFVYAVCFGLIRYVKDKLTRYPLDVRRPKDIPMLWPILLQLLPKKVQPDLETCCGMIGLLLDHGADLHTLYRDESFWDALLRTVSSGPGKDIPSFRKILLRSRGSNALANAAVDERNADHVSTSTAAASSAVAGGRTVLPLPRLLLQDRATQDSRCVFAAATTAISAYLPPSPMQTPTATPKRQSWGASSSGANFPEGRSLLRLQSLTFSANDQQRPQQRPRTAKPFGPFRD